MYKIENWNFQHLFEKEFRETSQNVNSIRQPILRKNRNNNCLNKLNELKFCEVSWNCFSNTFWKFYLSIMWIRRSWTLKMDATNNFFLRHLFCDITHTVSAQKVSFDLETSFKTLFILQKRAWYKYQNESLIKRTCKVFFLFFIYKLKVFFEIEITYQ